MRNRFKKGNSFGKGRPRGCRNKFTDLKISFIEAYHKIGGDLELARWAERHRTQFYMLLARMLPNRVDDIVVQVDLSRLTDEQLLGLKSGRLPLSHVWHLIERDKTGEC